MAVNTFAVVFGVFNLIWLPFAPFMPVDTVNMNYAGPIIGGIIPFGLADWLVRGPEAVHGACEQNAVMQVKLPFSLPEDLGCLELITAHFEILIGS